MHAETQCSQEEALHQVCISLTCLRTLSDTSSLTRAKPVQLFSPARETDETTSDDEENTVSISQVTPASESKMEVDDENPF